MLSTKRILNKTKDLFLAVFFPAFCVGCNNEMPPGDNWICSDCNRAILPVNMQICPSCKKITNSGRYCQKCKKDKYLKGVVCAIYYEEGPAREMVHNFKYNGVTSLGENLANFMANSLTKNQLIITNSYLTFVPLHYRRKAQRGYNQAEILARLIGQKTGLKVLDLLKKIKITPRQAQLSGAKRRKNLSGVFVLKKGIDIKNKKIIIIDDVMTTGSTLEECARILRGNGAKEVWGLVVARG